MRLIPAKNLATFGSEHIREAACHLIACLAEAGVVTTSDADAQAWDQLISTSLKRKEENVQQSAVIAFGALARYKGIDEQTVKECIDQTVATRHLYGRRGYALALGAIPFDIPRMDIHLPAVLSAVISAMTKKVLRFLCEKPMFGLTRKWTNQVTQRIHRRRMTLRLSEMLF